MKQDYVHEALVMVNPIPDTICKFPGACVVLDDDYAAFLGMFRIKEKKFTFLINKITPNVVYIY